jgi:hypothetical protein
MVASVAFKDHFEQPILRMEKNHSTLNRYPTCLAGVIHQCFFLLIHVTAFGTFSECHAVHDQHVYAFAILHLIEDFDYSAHAQWR